MTIAYRHIPFLVLTALPLMATIEPLSLYTMSTIHVSDAERWIVASVCLSVIVATGAVWRRHHVALPILLIAYGVFTGWSLWRLGGVIGSFNFTSWSCLTPSVLAALSPLPAAGGVLWWGEDYTRAKPFTAVAR